MSRATRSTKPRSSTGADVPSASRRPPSHERPATAITRKHRVEEKDRRDRERQREREPSNPFAHSQAGSAPDEPGLVAESAEPAGPPPALASVQSAGRGLQL